MTKKNSDYKNYKWHKVLNVTSDQNLTCEKKIKSGEKWWVMKSYKRQKVTREINHKWQKVTIGTKKKLQVSKIYKWLVTKID